MLNLFGFHSLDARRDNPHLVACWLLEQRLRECIQVDRSLHAYCLLCQEVVRIDVAAGRDVDAREGLACPKCGLSARVRTALATLEVVAPSAARVYMTEQATPAFAKMQSRYPALLGSEFEPDAERRAVLAERLAAMGGHGPIKFEDVTRLSQPSGTLDAIVSLDVLEHVPAYGAALDEFARVLAPDGVLVATFPFTDQPQTLTRATVGPDGAARHIEPPEFHGDPISGGVLCFYHFGWDVLDRARAAGFSDCQFVMAWAPECGALYGHWLLIARR